MTATIIGYAIVGGLDSWILRGSWGGPATSPWPGSVGDFYLAAANNSVGLAYPESAIFYNDSAFTLAPNDLFMADGTQRRVEVFLPGGTTRTW